MTSPSTFLCRYTPGRLGISLRRSFRRSRRDIRSVNNEGWVGHPNVSTLRGCEEIDLSDITGNPSPRPSPGGRGRAVSVTCQCIFFVEWEIHVQVTPLDRPLPPGEGWGEGLPATSVSPISSHPLRVAAVGRERRVCGARSCARAPILRAALRGGSREDAKKSSASKPSRLAWEVSHAKTRSVTQDKAMFISSP